MFIQRDSQDIHCPWSKKVSHRYHLYIDFYLWNKELKMSRVVFLFSSSIFTIDKSEIMWWLFIFKQMFHWKVVFIGWCNARFYDNIKNYGQQKKPVFNFERGINYAVFQLSFCVELHDPHDDQNTKWLNFSKCSPINFFTLQFPCQK